ncbi:MAG: hypothetical protein D6674_02920 [Acidobacteria bacterium]|nr:MAG: hypothetical protein D6674_02920 [Acidobacteriota bacterium]
MGGDDFIIVLWGIKLEKLVEKIKEFAKDLQQALLEFYKEEDRQRGYLIGEGRDGVKKEFPLASVSIAILKGSSDPLDISKRSAKLKREAKSKTGTAIAVEDLNQILTISP